MPFLRLPGCLQNRVADYVGETLLCAAPCRALYACAQESDRRVCTRAYRQATYGQVRMPVYWRLTETVRTLRYLERYAPCETPVAFAPKDGSKTPGLSQIKDREAPELEDQGESLYDKSNTRRKCGDGRPAWAKSAADAAGADTYDVQCETNSLLWALRISLRKMNLQVYILRSSTRWVMLYQWFKVPRHFTVHCFSNVWYRARRVSYDIRPLLFTFRFDLANLRKGNKNVPALDGTSPDHPEPVECQSGNRREMEDAHDATPSVFDEDSPRMLFLGALHESHTVAPCKGCAPYAPQPREGDEDDEDEEKEEDAVGIRRACEACNARGQVALSRMHGRKEILATCFPELRMCASTIGRLRPVMLAIMDAFRS